MVIVRPVASDEADVAGAWYAMHRDEDLANDFADAVEQALDMIERHPLAGVALDRHFRRVLVRRFPFSVVYRLHGEEVIVVASAHTSREPNYWRSRR